MQALTLQNRLLSEFAEHLAEPLKKVKRSSIFQVFPEQIKFEIFQGLAYGFASAMFFFVFAALFRFAIYLITNKPFMDSLDAMRYCIFLIIKKYSRVLFAVSLTSPCVALATAYFPDYVKARFAAGLIFKMMTELTGIDSLTTDGSKPEISGHVQLKGIHFRYPERPNIPILQGLDAEASYFRI